MFKKRVVSGTTASMQKRVKKRPLETGNDEDNKNTPDNDGSKNSSSSDSESDVNSSSDDDSDTPIIKNTTPKGLFKKRLVQKQEIKKVIVPNKPTDKGKLSGSDPSSDLDSDDQQDKSLTHTERLELQAQAQRRADLESLSKHTIQATDAQGNKIYTGTIKSHNADKSGLKLKGQATSIKTSQVFDFQADVCKDFLKNGYCGFGDTCKFLHYREEFSVVKNQKPKEWEEVAKRAKKW